MENNKLNSYTLRKLRYILEREIYKVKNFDKLTYDDKNNIEEIVKSLSKIYNKNRLGNEYYYMLLGYLYKFKSKKVQSLSSEEKLAIIIEIVDPEFEIYKIYEENCNMLDIKPKILEKFGFYDENFIKAERLYIEKFYDITEYEFIKKLEP